MLLTDDLKKVIKKESLDKLPNESGGLLYLKNNKIKIYNCRNVSPEPGHHYLISDKETKKVQRLGKIVGYFHSHPNDYDQLSQADIVIAEKLKLNSIVYCVEKNSFHEYEPCGFEMPYEGRERFFGVLDCLTLVIDYYKRELNITIDYLNHPLVTVNLDNWSKVIEQKLILNIEDEWLKKNNFCKVDNLKKHDLLVIQFKGFNFPTHTAIYLENNRFLHQLINISEISIYGRHWKNLTKGIYRHQKML